MHLSPTTSHCRDAIVSAVTMTMYAMRSWLVLFPEQISKHHVVNDIYSMLHSFIHSFIHSFVRSFIHSFFVRLFRLISYIFIMFCIQVNDLRVHFNKSISYGNRKINVNIICKPPATFKKWKSRNGILRTHTHTHTDTELCSGNYTTVLPKMISVLSLLICDVNSSFGTTYILYQVILCQMSAWCLDKADCVEWPGDELFKMT